MYREITGDIFTLDVDAIGHGVNCQGLMGAGIAVAIKKRFPYNYINYKYLCDKHTLRLGQVCVTDENDQRVYNIASQFFPGSDARMWALKAGVSYTRYHAEMRGLNTVALPQIGCGIGGLNWSEVRPAIIDIVLSSPVEFQLVTYG